MIARRRLLSVIHHAAVLAVLLAIAFAADRLFPPRLNKLAEVSTAVLDSDGRLLRAYTTADGTWRFATTPEDVDPRYLSMLLAYEDRRFRYHPGVDPLSLTRAFWQWLRAGHVVSGGSTLTMQVARLLEPRPRTLGAKLTEIVRAVQIERRYSKDEIVAMYLTLAPMGGNLEGVRAASLAYFGKMPDRLTTGQAALLVALPQSPTQRRPDTAPAAARQAAMRVLDRLATAGAISAQDAAEARQERLPSARLASAFTAPHLADRLRPLADDKGIVRTTIDGGLQTAAENLITREAAWLPQGARAALIVIDNRDRAVKAYVGGYDYFGPSGQVDLASVARSPGSTLKPFIYALAFDDLTVHPETIIEDRPTRFGAYAPRNFDQGFHGDVTVRDALQRSLNIPAVAVLDRVGPERFAGALADAGVALRLPPGTSRPSLPIALGGAGVRLDELTALYAALADGGQWRPLVWTQPSQTDAPRAFVSPVAAWYVTDILASAARPTSFAQTGSSGRRIAFKTGTSYGYRDSWAIGYGRRYTIGVWVGRPDGAPMPGATGIALAAPALFRLFDIAADDVGEQTPPTGTLRVAASRDLPGALQKLAVRERELPRSPRPGIEIEYPVEGAVVDLPRDGKGALSPLALKAQGGTGPWRWYADGRPLGVSERGDLWWQPDGPGFVRLTVVDEAGASVTTDIRIQTGPERSSRRAGL